MYDSERLLTNKINQKEQLFILSERYDEYIAILHEYQLLLRNMMTLNRGLHLEEIEENPGCYQLSEGINHLIWEKIGAYMHKVPRQINGSNLSRHWQVIKGKEKEVERILQISDNQSIESRDERYNIFCTAKKKLREYRMFFFQRIEILFRTYGLLVNDKSIKQSLYPSNKIKSQFLGKTFYFFPGTKWKSLLQHAGKWWVVDKSNPAEKKIWIVHNRIDTYQPNGRIKKMGVPDLIVFIKHHEVIEWAISELGKQINNLDKLEATHDKILYN